MRPDDRATCGTAAVEFVIGNTMSNINRNIAISNEVGKEYNLYESIQVKTQIIVNNNNKKKSKKNQSQTLHGYLVD